MLQGSTEVVLEGCRKKTSDYGDVLTACQQLVESHKTTTLALESFLKQYGYTTWGEVFSETCHSAQPYVLKLPKKEVLRLLDIVTV